MAAILAVLTGIGILRPASAGAQTESDLAGRWTLNRELSEFPREIGFGADWLSAARSAPDAPASGGRGRRGSSGGGSGPFTAKPQSEDDAKRVQQLTAEVRNPSAHLSIVETPTAVTITDDRGQSRTFHPNGSRESLQLEGVSVGVTAKRESGRLVVLYSVEQGRDLRYTYLRSSNPPRLEVDVQFVERGGGDAVKRVYEPASATETQTQTQTQTPANPAPSPATPKLGPAVPDAELKGLTKLGVVVEDLSPQGAACGLNHGALETAVSKRLSDAGFKVLRNSDEDTYVYVNIMTTSLPNGLCVSRYDAFLYTHTTARLEYQQAPVLVQVSLLHKGGIAGGGSAAHAEAVLRGVQDYVAEFSTRIRDANK
jgi:hypothetical protein